MTISSNQGLPEIKDIIEINYIENKGLEKQFVIKKAELLNTGRDNSELVLLHGTSPANTHDICKGRDVKDLRSLSIKMLRPHFSK